MRKLLFAAPLPGVGACTIAEILNQLPNVQAVAMYDLMLDEIADGFGISRDVFRHFKNEPSDLLSLFYADGETRLRLVKDKNLYDQRSASWYVQNYKGPLDNQGSRLVGMLGSVKFVPAADLLVFFARASDKNDMVHYQNYAKDSGREFMLVDLVRPGVPGLGKPLLKYEGASLIEVEEGNPRAAARAIYLLGTN